jgi:inosine triphosphate pyrophosphatase
VTSLRGICYTYPMKNLTFITGNAAKAKYLSDYFHMPVEHVKLDLKEIQSLDLSEVVKDKVLRAYEIVKKPVLVEDVSLSFNAMKSLPGPLIKWFYETLGNEGLCRLLDGFDDRTALAKVQFAICDENETHTFEGSIQGSIAHTPKGDVGFGWDPVFIPDGYTKTWAEMNESEREQTSMRKIALTKLGAFLKGRE